MKRSQSKLFVTIFLSIIFCSACNNDDSNRNLPYDQARADESVIPIDLAKQYQRNFLTTRDLLGRMQADSVFSSRDFNLPNAESFTRDAIILLLNQAGADGIRIYYGKDSAGVVRLVLLPVDKNGRDIQTTLIERQTQALNIPGIPSAHAVPPSEAQAVENGQTCPPCLID